MSGCDCTPKEITSESAVRDRPSIDLVFTLMCAIPPSRFKLWKISKPVEGPKMEIQVCFGKKYDFIVEPGINGMVFFLRLAASNTNMTRGGHCELCGRLFFTTRRGAKYCSDSCRVRSSDIRKGKRKWSHKVYFLHSLRKREKAILQEAKNGCKN